MPTKAFSKTAIYMINMNRHGTQSTPAVASEDDKACQPCPDALDVLTLNALREEHTVSLKTQANRDTQDASESDSTSKRRTPGTQTTQVQFGCTHQKQCPVSPAAPAAETSFADSAWRAWTELP
eukprot:Gregarina_sp_Poly_1__11317@NODE_947_length_5591_cov_64_240043_g671_i0_p7_GENE_NODE_947_length_5591_cov_64_240043_g671_i0NODE_947_length_5591_cov_64_240043_g671_i0_p7_ORF_typecomplete_len124_score16_99DUF3238/PF11579_8/0_043_NODE_947_length_5591_cov_64_240043_g671_i035563927